MLLTGWSAWETIFMEEKNMKFEYVPKSEFLPVKNKLVELIHRVQDEVRDDFTFRFDFIGSASRNMITRQVNGNIGYDFDVDIRVNDPEENYTAKKIKTILRKAFDKHCKSYGYDYGEDSSRVITIKVKDTKNAKIIHSCDLAIVRDCDDGRQQSICFNKKTNIYTWEYLPKRFSQLSERIAAIKENNLWQEVRDLYLEKKCNNTDKNKKSRLIFAETINEVYQDNFDE